MVPDDVFNDLKTIETRGAARKYIYGYLFEILEELKKQRSNKTPDTLDKIHNLSIAITVKILHNDVAYKLVSVHTILASYSKDTDTTFTNYHTVSHNPSKGIIMIHTYSKVHHLSGGVYGSTIYSSV